MDSIRCRLEDADGSLPSLRGLPARVAERRLHRIRRGSVLRDQLPLFPDRRTHRDVFCSVIFFCSFLLFILLGMQSSRLQTNSESALLKAPFPEWRRPSSDLYVDPVRRLEDITPQEDNVTWNIFLSVVTFSSVGGLLCALVVLQLLRSGGEEVFLHCTILLPVLRLVTGLLCMLYPFNKFTPDDLYKKRPGDGFVRDMACACYFLFGAALAACSLLNCCISLRVRHLARPWLALQANLMRTVSLVVLTNPGMLLIPLGCALVLYFWIVACISACTAILSDGESWLNESAILPSFLLMSWGGGVASYFAILAFCGVYSRWYHSRAEPPVLASFRSTMLFALGTASMASFLRPSVRLIELLSRLMQQSGPDCRANPFRACLTCLFGCILETLFGLVGDISSFFNTWVFTQCAIRNASFVEASYITFGVCNCANVTLLANNLALDYVTGSGTQIGGLLGLLVGAVAHSLGKWPWLHWAPATGFVCATIMTSIVLSVAKTGFKSILVLWAESSEQLRQLAPEAHEAIVLCIKKRVEENPLRRTASEMSQLSR